jgi:hypothetical protein
MVRTVRNPTCYAGDAMTGIGSKATSDAKVVSRLRAESRKVPRIMRIAERLGRRIPSGELRSLPKDLSSQLDHYIYGTPRR